MAEEVKARHEKLEAAEKAQRFLSEAGAALAKSLDYEATLQVVVRLALPCLADMYVVHIVEGDKARLVAIACTESEKEECLRDMNRRYPFAAIEQNPLWQALRTGQLQVFPKSRSLCWPPSPTMTSTLRGCEK